MSIKSKELTMRIRSLTIALIALTMTGVAAAQTGAPPAAARGATLRNPAAATEKAPATYKVKFDTSAGPFVVQVHRDWAPNGADRFYNLVKAGFYDDVRFFR